MLEELQVSYTVWKQVVQNNNLTPYLLRHGTNQGEILAGTDLYLFVSEVSEEDLSDFLTTFSSTYQEITSRDDTKALIIGTSQIVSEHRTGMGVSKVAVEKSDDTFVTLYSHNWCDKTTWYEGSEYITSGVATDTGDHLSYNLTHSGIIDTYHGKLTGEDFFTDSNSNSYRVAVFVNGELSTEKDPHTLIGDYVVDYTSGVIVFDEALEAEDEVVATYHYANTAILTLIPTVGKTLSIECVEVQMSDDVEISDTLTFTMYGYVDIFAPHLVNNPYPPGTKIPLANPLTFKTIQDYMNDAIRAYPAYPPMGGSGWRGCSQPINILDWDYLRSRPLHSSLGMEIRIELSHNQEFGGSWATATFYCVTADCPY